MKRGEARSDACGFQWAVIAIPAGGCAQQAVLLKTGGEPAQQGNTDVRWGQASLSKILRLRLAMDGQMGVATCRAICNFQQQRGLQVAVIVGPQIERALIATGADAGMIPILASERN